MFLLEKLLKRDGTSCAIHQMNEATSEQLRVSIVCLNEV